MTETQTLFSSKFWRTLLTLVSVILIFAGPTYGIYVLAVILKVNLAVSFATGFILFAVGMMLLWYLLKNKVIE
ncbi:MAG: hypothetical protein N3D85_05160 [Candidatus Bathyarchaeota archaeon]|nr:hypothetical protein [Candidatus Bathyarchaeota archaeon]